MTNMLFCIRYLLSVIIAIITLIDVFEVDEGEICCNNRLIRSCHTVKCEGLCTLLVQTSPRICCVACRQDNREKCIMEDLFDGTFD